VTGSATSIETQAEAVDTAKHEVDLQQTRNLTATRIQRTTPENLKIERIGGIARGRRLRAALLEDPRVHDLRRAQGLSGGLTAARVGSLQKSAVRQYGKEMRAEGQEAVATRDRLDLAHRIKNILQYNFLQCHSVSNLKYTICYLLALNGYSST
jgi:hypothetical protein